jgi:hypothetical protein
MDAKCQLIAYRLDKQRRADLDGETATKRRGLPVETPVAPRRFQGPSPSKVPSVGLHSLRMEVHSCYIYIALPGGPTLLPLVTAAFTLSSLDLSPRRLLCDLLARCSDLARTSMHSSLLEILHFYIDDPAPFLLAPVVTLLGAPFPLSAHLSEGPFNSGGTSGLRYAYHRVR